MTERFTGAFNVLTTAYFEGELEKGNCCACAVGNMCGRRCYWNNVFVTFSGDNTQLQRFGWHPELETLMFLQTGYSAIELAKIESAFEGNTKIHSEDYFKHTEQEILEDQYNGLAAVVEVLCQLDNIETVQEHKAEFRKHPKLVTV